MTKNKKFYEIKLALKAGHYENLKVDFTKVKKEKDDRKKESSTEADGQDEKKK